MIELKQLSDDSDRATWIADRLDDIDFLRDNLAQKGEKLPKDMEEENKRLIKEQNDLLSD